VSDLRVALVGYGLAGRVFHAPLIAAASGLTVATVVTANPDRAAAAAATLPGVTVLPDPAGLWSAAADHDLVVVATATGAHAPVAHAALGAGLPVVVDKPLTVDPADARRLVKQAARRGLLLCGFHNRRWDSDTLTVRRLLAEGRLGAVHRFESRFERFRPWVRPDAWRERASIDQGGGTLLDLGSHVVDQALHLFGPVVTVYAEVQRLRAGIESDDEVFLALLHGSGVRSLLWASALSGLPGPRVRVLGNRGAFVADELDRQEAALRSGLVPGDFGWAAAISPADGRLGDADGERWVPAEIGRWDAFYPAVRDALVAGGPPPVSGEEAAAVVEVLAAARASAAAGTVVLL
jgi:scyllo-inositol 2-dehydrogenase (NADP+)